MWLMVLEALGAGLMLVFIVWWTMFSGRHRGERTPESKGATADSAAPAAPPPPARDGPAA